MSLLDQQAQACYLNLSSALVTSVQCRVQKSFSNFYRQLKKNNNNGRGGAQKEEVRIWLYLL